MTIKELLSEYFAHIFAGIAAFVGLLYRIESNQVRNNLRLDHLEAQQDRDRDETRAMLTRIEADVKSIETDIKKILEGIHHDR